MASSTHTAPLTEHEVDLLRRYAGGEDVATIADQLAMGRQVIGDTLIRLCNLNRNAAKELLRFAPRADPKPAPPAPKRRSPAPLPTAVEVEPADAPTEPAADVDEPAQAPTGVGGLSVLAKPVRAFEVLDQWPAWHCSACPFTGAVTELHVDCAEPLVRARILVVTAEDINPAGAT